MIHLRRRLSGTALEVDLAARVRTPAFPFVSGDTFRAACDRVIDESRQVDAPLLAGQTVFVATKYSDRLLRSAEMSDPDTLKTAVSVIVHNGDLLPSTDRMQELTATFSAVWSVNVTSELRELGIRPVPIGLENAHWKGAGEPHLFALPSERNSLIPVARRRTLVFASFRCSTNPGVREPLRSQVRLRGGTWLEPTRDSNRYLRSLRESMFVLSPQGNGLDCHRTWEALYCGAVPVITTGTLPPDLVNKLPIVEVQRWDDFLDLSDTELIALASTMSQRSMEAAYMPFWCKHVLAPKEG